MKMRIVGMWFLVCALFAVGAAGSRAGTLEPVLGCAVLGAAAVTNTGPTVVSGGVCVSPGTAISGFPPGVVNNGIVNDNNGPAGLALSAATFNFGALQGMSSTANLTGQNLGGLTLTDGVYSFSSSAQLTGALTLNFQGLNNQTIVFLIGTSLTTASGSSVLVTNPGTNDNIYWVVGSSATLGTTTSFIGNVIADQSITLDTSATINCGSALALTGAVTMDDNTITGCSAGTSGSGGSTGGATPEPGSLLLLGTGLIGCAGVLRRKLGGRKMNHLKNYLSYIGVISFTLAMTSVPVRASAVNSTVSIHSGATLRVATDNSSLNFLSSRAANMPFGNPGMFAHLSGNGRRIPVKPMIRVSYESPAVTAGQPSGGSVVPEPSTLLLLGTGLLGCAGLLRRKLLG